jgi:hypothetical protein
MISDALSAGVGSAVSIAVEKILTGVGCARIGRPSGGRARLGPWWRTGALADGSRHGAGVFGPV